MFRGAPGGQNVLASREARPRLYPAQNDIELILTLNSQAPKLFAQRSKVPPRCPLQQSGHAQPQFFVPSEKISNFSM